MSRAHGIALAESGNLSAAEDTFREAGDWINLSVALARQKRYADAREAALRCPDPLKAHSQAMAVCWESGNVEGIREHLTAGLDIDPSNPDLLTARGAFRLARGDQGGWEDAEHRPWARKMREACDEFPEWDGKTPVTGKRLLVLYQDGHGDRVMYSRFLSSILEQKPERLVLFCSAETVRLFHESFPGIHVVSSHEEIGTVDMWIGQSSLGKCRFPIDGKPYLKVPEDRLRQFAGYIKQTDNLRVGLVWAGNAKHTQDHTRSLPFSAFEPLLEIPGIDFYSLQFEEHNRDHKGRLNELSIYCRDTADTCAAIANLDLVIGVDTGMIHFAGALGVPAWVLCFTPIDWRWGTEEAMGGDPGSYWYDSVKVFRNASMTRAAQSLNVLAKGYQIAPPTRVVEPIPVPATKTCKFRYGNLEVFANDLWLGRSIEEYGEWSDAEVQLLSDILTRTPNAGVVEAGANVGAHTIPMSRMCARILAFEPQDQARALLERNLAANGITNVVMAPQALGAVHESALIQQPDMTQVNSQGSAELFYEDGQLSNTDPSAGIGWAPQPVQVIPLDALNLDQLDLLKADIEGSELAMLEGAENTIKRCRPVIYLESNREDNGRNQALLLDVLTQFGYRVYEHRIRLFNPENWSKNPVNIFGMLESTMLLAIPKERYDLREITNRLKRLRP